MRPRHGGERHAAFHLAARDVLVQKLAQRGLDRGILVSRFHYVNGLLDTRRAVMTGMTRDGTFWVENGRPVRAIRNMRFTDSILEAFARAVSDVGLYWLLLNHPPQ